ncbi:MAG: T9SS type A sorting domain-containing protein [Bacteroidota bacterium]
MKTQISVLLLCWMGWQIPLLAQNNPVFKGGKNDGHVTQSFSQAQNHTIFKGGQDDGHHMIRHSQADNHEIFQGGPDDGITMDHYSVSLNGQIFKGGPDDGICMEKFAQADNHEIFRGGDGDGAAHVYFCLQRNNSIFSGGFNDGVDNSRIFGLFVIQHPAFSSTHSHFETQPKEEEIIDGERDGLSVSLYPNPTADLLHIRLTGEIPGDLGFRVFDLMGRDVGISRSIQDVDLSLETHLNLSSLSVGIYVLQITHRHKGIIGAYRIQVRR